MWLDRLVEPVTIQLILKQKEAKKMTWKEEYRDPRFELKKVEVNTEARLKYDELLKRHREEISAFKEEQKLSNQKFYYKTFGKHKTKQYKEMVSELLGVQEGNCDICKEPFTFQKKPCLDHCHNTNQIRGLLCNGCNSGIGFLNHDPQWLRNAAEYMDKHNSVWECDKNFLI